MADGHDKMAFTLVTNGDARMRGRTGIGVAAMTWALIGGTAQGVSYEFSALLSPEGGATTADFVTLQVGGVWSDSCIPNHIAHQRVGETIYVEVEFPGIDVGCLTALTPWSLSQSLGRLPAGEYDVVGTYFAVDPFPPVRPREQYGEPAEWVTDYRVTRRMPGDVDHDGRVGRGDLAMLAKEFGSVEAGGMSADVNRDAQISLTDLAFLAAHFDAPAPSVVPEPFSVVQALAAVALVMLASRRWRSNL
jgi:hypothetical protein